MHLRCIPPRELVGAEYVAGNLDQIGHVVRQLSQDGPVESVAVQIHPRGAAAIHVELQHRSAKLGVGLQAAAEHQNVTDRHQCLLASSEVIFVNEWWTKAPAVRGSMPPLKVCFENHWAEKSRTISAVWRECTSMASSKSRWSANDGNRPP